jgi:putative FmdB family regulatory protein
MPTYSYKCTECEHSFDAVQSITDASLTACPSCSGPLRKVFGLTGVTFNGTGFYRTDSRAGSAPSASSSSGASSSSASSNS